MAESLRLIPPEEEQPHLPGIPKGKLPIQSPLVSEVSESAEPIPGQLVFGPNQRSLEEVAPEPVQLSMLDEPPPWESSEEPPPQPRNKGRLRKRRTRRGITPGQTSLF